MSWFTSFFTPNDARKPPAPPEKRLLEETPPLESTEQTEAAAPLKADTPPNPHRPKLLFGAGVTFFALSILVTRRSLARRRLAATPAYYTNAPGHNEEQAKKVSGGLEAFEALNLATINVMSVGIMATGAAMWYFDVNSMEDLRRRMRRGLGVDGSGRSENEVEEQFEEYLASILTRKEARSEAKSVREAAREEFEKQRRA